MTHLRERFSNGSIAVLYLRNSYTNGIADITFGYGVAGRYTDCWLPERKENFF